MLLCVVRIFMKQTLFGNRKGCFQVASFRFEGNRQFQNNMVARVIERGIKKICNIFLSFYRTPKLLYAPQFPNRDFF